MPFLEWDDRFSVNEPFLDSHHKKLFSIMNKLYDSINEKQNSQDISTIVTDLIHYTKYHFTEEEKYLTKNHIAQLEQQKKEHALFFENAWKYLEHLNTDYSKTGDEILEFLKTWWYDHILKLDMQYKDVFTN